MNKLSKLGLTAIFFQLCTFLINQPFAMVLNLLFMTIALISFGVDLKGEDGEQE